MMTFGDSVFSIKYNESVLSLLVLIKRRETFKIKTAQDSHNKFSVKYHQMKRHAIRNINYISSATEHLFHLISFVKYTIVLTVTRSEI